MKQWMDGMGRFWFRRSLGVFLVRLAAGAVFFAHGLSKFQHMDMFQKFFATLGLPAPVATAIAVLEVVGGVLLVAGVATRIFAALFTIEMITAVFLTGVGRGWFAHEMEIVLILLSLSLVLTGSGRWSLYKMHCDRCGAMSCKGDCNTQSE